MFPPLKFEKNILKLLDQRKLPSREIWISCRTSKQVQEAIRQMVVRGAPAIGVAAGYGLYLGISKFKGSPAQFFKKLEAEAEFLKTARPTAVNLRNVVDGIVAAVKSWVGAPLAGARSGRAQGPALHLIKRVVLTEARRAHTEDDRHASTAERSRSRGRTETQCSMATR